jgi:hypothetical protein
VTTAGHLLVVLLGQDMQGSDNGHGRVAYRLKGDHRLSAKLMPTFAEGVT